MCPKPALQWLTTQRVIPVLLLAKCHWTPSAPPAPQVFHSRQKEQSCLTFTALKGHTGKVGVKTRGRKGGRQFRKVRPKYRKPAASYGDKDRGGLSGVSVRYNRTDKQVFTSSSASLRTKCKNPMFSPSTQTCCFWTRWHSSLHPKENVHVFQHQKSI